MAARATPARYAMQTVDVNLWNWLLAASPIAAVLVLMVGLHWGGTRAGPAGWLVAVLVAWLGFGAGPELLWVSQLRGVLLTLYVLYIVWSAMALYRVVDEAGALAAVGAGISRLTADRTMQLLLIAWIFCSFVQGVAGFGVGIAISTPLLIGLGFSPVLALSAVAIGHCWAVNFGSMGSSFLTLIAQSGLSGYELAPWSSFLLGVTCLGCGMLAVWIDKGWSSVRQAWPALLIVGLLMAGVQAGMAVIGLWNLAGFGAGLAGLGVAPLVVRLPRYRGRPHASGVLPDGDRLPAGAAQAANPRGRAMPLGLAVAPYLVLIVVVGAAELWPWLNDVLNRVALQADFPEVQTAYGWATAAGPGRSVSVFGHAGALLLYVAVLSYAVFRLLGYYTPGVTGRIVRSTVRGSLPASYSMLALVGMALAMDHSGMTYILARGLSQVAGPFYAVVSPYIGLLGAFMTGSNTNSNVVFVPLQQQAATLLELEVRAILGAQTTGGSLGSMIAPAKIIIGAATVGLVGQEGKVLKYTLLPAILLTGVVGLITWWFA
jgi:lactate permease